MNHLLDLDWFFLAGLRQTLCCICGIFFCFSPFQAGRMPAEVGLPPLRQRWGRRPGPGLCRSCRAAGQGSGMACCRDRMEGAGGHHLVSWAQNPAKSDFLSTGLMPDNFNMDMWLCRSWPAAIKPVFYGKLVVWVWLENPCFVQKNDGKHGEPLVQKFLRILSPIPEAAPLSILVGLHWLRMLLVLPEEHYFSQSSSSWVSAEVG